MKYEIELIGEAKEYVKSDTFDTNAGLVVFYNSGEVPEGHKYATQIGVAAFPLANIKSIRTIN